MIALRRAAALTLLLLLAACAPTAAPPSPVATQPAASGAPSAAATPAATTAAATSAPAQTIAVAPVTMQLPQGFAVVSDGGFAPIALPDVKADAALPDIAIPVDLAGVSTPVLLSPEQRAAIGRQGFVISPNDAREFYELYERNRYDFVPSFVTSDSLLHGYHVAFDAVLRQSEQSSFAPILVQLDHAMLAQSVAYYEQLGGTPWAEAARRNAAYFAVPVALLEPDWPVPPALADLVAPELAAVRAHAATLPSPIFPDDQRGEDYTQYTPRGHYTKTEELTRYFQAMMWHGRRSFSAAKGSSGGDGQTMVRRQEVLMIAALSQAKAGTASALDLWRSIYEPTSFFVGQTDGLTPVAAIPALEQIYGQTSDVKQLADDAKLAQFDAAIEDLRVEVIQDIVTGDAPATVPGMRFMGARLVPDAAIFSQLVAPKVPKRLAPKALDVFAAIGSERALTHLTSEGDTAIAGYSANMGALRDQFAHLPQDTWSSSVYWGWLDTLRPLIAPVPQGYPAFMRSDAWLDKQLQTALGSWTELKHDTLLYAKQIAVEAGFDRPPPEPELPRGYVEPSPLVYARVAALSEMTKRGLEQRGLLTESGAGVLDATIGLAQRLQRLAEKELRGESLSADDALFIHRYGIELEKLTKAAEYDTTPAAAGTGEPPQAQLVADIATTPDGIVHVGSGRIFHIFVAVPVDGTIIVMRGGVYSFYEFTEAERLSDETWRARLDAGQAPPRPAWMKPIEVDATVASLLTDRILGFNDAITNAFWYTEPGQIDQYLVGAELDDTRRYIDQLKSQKQFLGQKRLAIEFRSFDVTGDRATVTTQERWDERFYTGTSFDYQEDPKPVRQRIYTANVTYSMVRQADAWMIEKIVVQEQK